MPTLSLYSSLEEEYYDYALTRSTSGKSNMAPSYRTAIRIMNDVFSIKAPNILYPEGNLLAITDIQRIKDIRDFVLAEAKKPNGGIFCDVESPSYWKNHYCSAALGILEKFREYLVYRDDLLEKAKNTTDPVLLAKETEKQTWEEEVPTYWDELGISLDNLVGKDKQMLVKVRQNQQKFRTVVLWNYQNQCCISGMPILHTLQASHIESWSEDPTLRLDPTNGLCLTATYHAAFDHHLISFDKKYRLILSKSLRDYTTNEAYQDQFLKYEGKPLHMPIRFMPRQDLLEKHRNLLVK